MNAMILAAGRGERLRPVTDSVPKALVEVRGERLVDRHLRMLAAAGCQTIVINLGWLGEYIVEHVGSGEQFGLSVVYSPEYDEVLETGGGICRALPVLGDAPFWVVNADIFTDFSIPDHSLSSDVDAELVLVDTPPHKRIGDFDVVDNLVRNGPERQLTYGGIARYRPSFFAEAGEGRFSVVPLLRAAADAGKLGGTHYRGDWHDVGSSDRLEALNQR
jgi:MurNAc alpha-1-phosphate uridylyltransferase